MSMPTSNWEKNEAEIQQTDNSPEEGQEQLPQDPNWKPWEQ